MTAIQVLLLIKAAMGGDDSDLRNQVAQAALEAAYGAFNRLGVFHWNTVSTDVSLTSGTGSYEFADLWGDHTVRGIGEKLYYTDVSKYVEVLDEDVFNMAFRYRMTTAGRPTHATVHSKDGTIEFYPKPDSAYTLRGQLLVSIGDINDIPDEFHDLVVSRATIRATGADTPANASARAEWAEGKEEIRSDRKYTIFTGTKIAGDPGGPGQGRGMYTYTTSENLTGA